MRWVWLRHLFVVGVEKTREAMVTGCESWLVSLGRGPVVEEGKGPVCLPVGWSFVGGGAMWWAHTLFGSARTPLCVLMSTSGCVFWDFARENGVGSGGPQTQIGVGSHWVLFHEPRKLTMPTGKPSAC